MISACPIRNPTILDSVSGRNPMSDTAAKTTLTLAGADKVMAAAEAYAAEQGWKFHK